LDIRQLEVFICVADHKGFLSAAEELHLSQSTVSNHIAALEEELQAQLIKRTTRSFKLTRYGEMMYDYASDILALQKKAIRELSRSANCLLNIGASSVPAQCIVPQLLNEFNLQYPGTHYEITVADSLDIIQMVSIGRLDVGFVGTKTDAECSFVPVATDELVIAAPNTEEYRELKDQDDPFRTLLTKPFLMREEQSATKKETLRFFQDHGVSPNDLNVIAYINDALTLRFSVLNGLGISILSYRTVQSWEESGRLLTFPLGKTSFFRTLYLAYKKSNYMPQHVESFIRYSSKHCRRMLYDPE
jgi:DNA-binding transcriptional LysR family regulator